jgi:hypothetical protein
MRIGVAGLGGDAAVELNGTSSINIAAATDTEFLHADSVLQLQALGGKDNTYTLQNNIDPGVDGNGIIILHADGDDGALAPTASKLTLDGTGGETIGVDPGNKIKELRATGNKVSTITANVDLKNVPLLNVEAGATLVSNSASAFQVAVTNIGGAAGGSLTIDTEGADHDLLNAKAINFAHADSMLTLTNNNVAATASIITLHANLVGGGDEQGNLTITSQTETITIAPNTPLVPETIGTALARLKSLTVGGNENTIINVPVYAKKINIAMNSKECVFEAVVDAGVGGEMKVTKNNLTPVAN